MLFPGLYHCPLVEAFKLMPDLRPQFLDAPLDKPLDAYMVDVKIHMLMPGMWPCIPNWHCDFVPRIDGVEHPEFNTPEEKMFLWVSGEPLTEFRLGVVPAKRWVTFTQGDEHRGCRSEIHTWRTFIRIAPIELAKKAGVGDCPATPERWIRRHTQVYLDARDYRW